MPGLSLSIVRHPIVFGGLKRGKCREESTLYYYCVPEGQLVEKFVNANRFVTAVSPMCNMGIIIAIYLTGKTKDNLRGAL